MQDQEMIQTFSPHTSQKTLTDGIRLRSSIRCGKHLDPTCCRHPRKTRPEFAVIISHQICWCLSIRSRFPQLLRHPQISGRSRHIHMHDLARFEFDDEESKKRTEKEIRHLLEITGPYLWCMIAQERFLVLSKGLFWANLSHILLNRPFTDPNIQLEKLTPNALCSPESVACCHLLD
jgi:hypothetical protein